MGHLYRKKKVLIFDDAKVEVCELSYASLLKSQYEGITIDNEFLIRECTGLDPKEISGEAYIDIIRTIEEVNDTLFKVPKSEETVKKKPASGLRG